MKLKYMLLFFTAICFLISCTEETEIEESIAKEKPIPEEPKEEVYLTYRLNEHSDTTEIEYWVIVHNQDGELLDYKSIKEDSTLTFSAIDTALVNTEKLVVTTLSVAEYDNLSSHNLYTYTDIPKGFKWNSSEPAEASSIFIEKLNTYKSNESTNNLTYKAGNSSITVNSAPTILKYQVYSPKSGVVDSNYNIINEETFSIENIELLSGIRYLFFIGDAEESLKYHFFELGSDSQDVILDYNQFKDYEYVLETTLPQNAYQFSSSNGFGTLTNPKIVYETSVELNFDNPTVSRIGYISGFDSYSTSFSIKLENDYIYFYSKNLHQLPPEEIKILERPSFNIIQDALYNFEFNTDSNYISSSSIWNSETLSTENRRSTTTWKIFSSNKSSHTVGSLPGEVNTLYPNLDLDNLKYSQTHLIIQGKTYESTLKNLSNPNNSTSPKINESLVLYPEQD